MDDASGPSAATAVEAGPATLTTKSGARTAEAVAATK